MIEVGLFAVIALGLAVWTALPLFAPRTVTQRTDGRTDELIEQKQQLYRSILDLEFDRRLGKVSDDDFAHLTAQYEREALAILRELDIQAGGEEATDVLEAEIAAARERRLGDR